MTTPRCSAICVRSKVIPKVSKQIYIGRFQDVTIQKYIYEICILATYNLKTVNRYVYKINC